MKTENKKQWVVKLLREEISREEERRLLNFHFVKRNMERQWEHCEKGTTASWTQKQKIWNAIKETIWSEKQGKQSFGFYKLYSIAATVALFLATSMCVFLSLSDKSPKTNYLMTSGIQRIESVTLPDGTFVQLGPGSTLEFPSQFAGRERKVKLEGQAFFDVAPAKRSPFIVETPTMSVQALGTAFELFCHKKKSKSEVILLNGKVKISIPDEENSKITDYYLLPNGKFVFDNSNGKASKLVVDADKYTSWRKQKILTFENEKLSMIIPRLEQWYGRNIICQKDLSENYRFSFKVRDESIEKILSAMEESSPLKYKKTDSDDYMLILKTTTND